jgi:hypothetical protein
MKITRDEANQFMQKWHDEQTRISVAFEGPDTHVAFKFVGSVSELNNDLLQISQGDTQFFMALAGTDFEYKDAREAPTHAQEWAEASIEGCLLVCGPAHAWHCSLFELK